MAGTVDAGELKLTLKLMRENFAQGMKAVEADIAKLGTTTAGTGKKGASALGGLEKSLAGIGTQLMAMAGAYVGVQRLVSEFVAFGKEVTEINRAEAALKEAGFATSGFREQLGALGTEFIRYGQREEDAYRGFQRLIRATGDETKSWKLLDTAMKFAAATGEDAGTVVQSMTSAFSGQEMMLKRLLMRYGVAETDLTGWNKAIEAMTGIADTATGVLSDQDTAIFNLNASWDTFSDTLNNKATPAIVSALDALSAMMSHPEILGFLATGGPLATQKLSEAMFQDWLDRNYPAPFVGPPRPKTGPDKREPAKWGRGTKAEAAPAPHESTGQWYLDALKREKLAIEEEEKALKELEDAWRESHKIQLELIDDIGQELKSSIIDGLVDGEFNIRSFEKSFLRMLLNIAANQAWDEIAGKLRGMLGWGSWRGGGVPGGTEGIDFDPGSGGGAGIAGRGGPRPIGPGMGGGVQPVYVTVKGDLTRYAEFKIVSAGLRQGRQAGF